MTQVTRSGWVSYVISLVMLLSIQRSDHSDSLTVTATKCGVIVASVSIHIMHTALTSSAFHLRTHRYRIQYHKSTALVPAAGRYSTGTVRSIPSHSH